MSDLILHNYFRSSTSVRVRAALNLKGLPFDYVPLSLLKGEQASAEHLALNPQGLIPVLETPDGPIFETAAILLWLADRHGLMAPAPQTPDRAAFLSWLLFVSNTLHPTVMAQIYPGRLAGEAAAPLACQAAFARLQGQCALLEAIMGKAPAWANADAPSILSPYLAVLLRWAQVLAADPACNIDLAAYPALHGHLVKLETRPAFVRVAQAEALGPTPFSNPQV